MRLTDLIRGHKTEPSLHGLIRDLKAEGAEISAAIDQRTQMRAGLRAKGTSRELERCEAELSALRRRLDQIGPLVEELTKQADGLYYKKHDDIRADYRAEYAAAVEEVIRRWSSLIAAVEAAEEVYWSALTSPICPHAIIDAPNDFWGINRDHFEIFRQAFEEWRQGLASEKLANGFLGVRVVSLGTTANHHDCPAEILACSVGDVLWMGEGRAAELAEAGWVEVIPESETAQRRRAERRRRRPEQADLAG